MLKYYNEQAARNVQARAPKILMIVMGDDNKFWLCTPAQAQRLESQGYEILVKESPDANSK